MSQAQVKQSRFFFLLRATSFCREEKGGRVGWTGGVSVEREDLRRVPAVTLSDSWCPN